MTNPRPTPKRFRPRFSIRTLVILVTLVCVYLASWLATTRTGVNDVVAHVKAESPPPQFRGDMVETIESQSAVLPFVVLVDQWHPTAENAYNVRRRYYFWFLGYVAKLPT